MSISRRFVVLALFGSLLGLLAGCSGDVSDPTVREATDEVLAVAYAAAGPVDPVDSDDIPDGCWVETATDEYGFETEVLRCDEGAVDPGISAEGLQAWLDGPDARRMAVQFRNLVVLQTGCTRAGRGQLEVLREITDVAPEELRPHLASAISALDRSARACNTNEERWRRQLSQALDELESVIDLIEEGLGA